jgi:hypothetical protein
MEITMTHEVVEKNKKVTGKNQESHPDVENRLDAENIKKIELN